MAWTAPMIEALSGRSGYVVRWLFRAWPKDRINGEEVDFGIWSGDHDATIAGSNYIAARGAFVVDPIIYATGLNVRTQTLMLGGNTPETEQLVRGYDPSHARCEVHMALYNPTTLLLIGTQRMFRGQIDGDPVNTPAVNGEATVQINMTSAVRTLTQTLALKKSDESQKQRGGDRGRRWSSVPKTSSDPWGGE
jgi:hypothetical protein